MFVMILPMIIIVDSCFLQVAIICNHQRSVSKSHDAQMTRLNEKIDELKVGFCYLFSQNRNQGQVKLFSLDVITCD